MAAVGSQDISRIVGYLLDTFDSASDSPNLPQSIVILSEANDTNQSGLVTTPVTITSAKQAGQKYGFGSPIYAIARIVLPLSGAGISGIPVIVMAQAKAGGSTKAIRTITPMGTATANGTHVLRIAGRENIAGTFYNININKGDTSGDITAKIEDAVNNVLGCPCIGTSTEYEALLTTKWSGLTAEETTVTIDTGTTSLGITYVIANTQAGSGTPDISGALAQFGSAWNTIVINGYGTNTQIMTALEAFNGRPDPTMPTGRYAGIIFKPFVALTGSTADDPSSITDARLDDLTIAICPAPSSPGYSFEAAANMCAIYAPIASNTPAQDVGGTSYPDMPVPMTWDSSDTMSDYNSRNNILLKGCSTVDLISDQYQVQDFVTTYHPIGETPPQFAYVRNLNLDWNVRFGYYLLEQLYVIGKVIAGDNDPVGSPNVIQPKQWKGRLFGYADELVAAHLITDAAFMKASITVAISTSNPNRFDTFFRYKRTGVARVSATTAQAGFNFGTLN